MEQDKIEEESKKEVKNDDDAVCQKFNVSILLVIIGQNEIQQKTDLCIVK